MAPPGRASPEPQVIATLVGIYLSPQATGLPRSVDWARGVPGRGLEGDRYFAGRGTWSHQRRLWSDLTLIESEAIEEAALHGLGIDPGEARRNLVTSGARLVDLIGCRVRIGDVEIVGERPCHPCGHLDRLTGQPAKAALAGRGGLRASICAGGILRAGDPLVLL